MNRQGLCAPPEQPGLLQPSKTFHPGPPNSGSQGSGRDSVGAAPPGPSWEKLCPAWGCSPLSIGRSEGQGPGKAGRRQNSSAKGQGATAGLGGANPCLGLHTACLVPLWMARLWDDGGCQPEGRSAGILCGLPVQMGL